MQTPISIFLNNSIQYAQLQIKEADKFFLDCRKFNMSFTYINTKQIVEISLINNITQSNNLMKQYQPDYPNNSATTPNGFLFGLPTPNLPTVRPRLNSFNSPFISPLRLIHSPQLPPDSMFDLQLHNERQFRLDTGNIVQQKEQSSSSSEQQQQQPTINTEISQENMLHFILEHVNNNETKLNQIRSTIQEESPAFAMQVFDHLFKKFKKLKKTKQQMIKYCIRKSFRSITDKMRQQLPNYSQDSNDYMALYFKQNSQEQQITIPFKKDSLQKTMNTNFLKKIFTCKAFVRDYKLFLKSFQKQCHKDNEKKVKGLNSVIISSLKNKNMKDIQAFKRLPWTKHIVTNIVAFANNLLEYCPFKHDEQQYKHNETEHQPEKIKQFKMENYSPKKKSIILLTPPMQPLNGPNIPQQLLQ